MGKIRHICMGEVRPNSPKQNRKSVAKPRPKRGKHLQWSEASMAAAVEAVKQQSMSQRKASAVFNIPRCTLQVRLSGKTEMGARPGHPTTLQKEQEEKLVDYACNRSALGIGFGRTQFLRYAQTLAKKYQTTFKQNLPSLRWWRGMKKRHARLTLRQPEGTASVRHQCMDPTKVAKYFLALRDVMQKEFIQSPEHVWNMDETGLQLDHKPGKVIAEKGSKSLHSRTSGNRELITVIGTVNASGNCIPPHVVVKGKTQRSLLSFQTETAPENTTWSVSESGWTKQGIALLWFKQNFLPNIGLHRPQLLIVDGHDSHNFLELIECAIQNNIHIIELPAHTSNWLQPLDRTVYGPLKSAYRKECDEFMRIYPGVVVCRSNFCGLLKRAWIAALTQQNIKSGFQACGIYPFNPDAIPSEAFIPNYLYSVRQLIDKEDASKSAVDTLQTNGEEPVPDGDTAKSTAADLNPRNLVVIEDTNCKQVVNLADYTSDNAEIVTAVVEKFPPQQALSVLEAALTEQQLTCYNYCYEKQYTFIEESNYLVWKKLKQMTLCNDSCMESVSLDTQCVAQSTEIATDVGQFAETGDTIEASKMNVIDKIMLASEEVVPINGVEVEVISSNVLVEDPVNLTLLDERFGHSSVTSGIHPDVTFSTQATMSGSHSTHPSVFPFKNKSFPGDIDSDVLPYPDPVKRKAQQKQNKKYFLLTSMEAYTAKVKDVKEKEERKRAIEEKNKARQVRDERGKMKLCQTEPVAKETVVRKKSKSVTSSKESYRRKHEINRAVAVSKCPSQKVKNDETPCSSCYLRYCDDTSGSQWIMCQNPACRKWYHNSCQGLQENFPNDEVFFCIQCEDNS